MVKIGEGMVSEAYLEDGRVYLIGKRPDAFKIYTELKRNLDFFQGKIGLLKIPSNAQLIDPCERYPLGAISFDYVKGTTLDKKIGTCTEAQKAEIGKRLAEFITEMTGLTPRDTDSKQREIETNRTKFANAINLIAPHLTQAENEKLKSIEIDYSNFLEQSEFCMTHGDLHFENLVVDDENKLVGIIDFGNVEYYVREIEFMWMQGYDDNRYKGDKTIFDNMIASYPMTLNANKIKLTRLVGAIRFFRTIVNIYTHLLDESIPVIRGLIERYEVE